METNLRIYPKYTLSNQRPYPAFMGNCSAAVRKKQPSAKCWNEINIIETRPVNTTSATGLAGIIPRFKRIQDATNSFFKSYYTNIQHTYEHKIYFAIIEKELFGKNSIDSLTHDADKMLLYMFGFPKSFVSSFHRKHSKHHVQSGKSLNL